ncbi:MAG: hypothetical protein QOF48_2897 [Verrucomicrobiota bacterium]
MTTAHASLLRGIFYFLLATASIAALPAAPAPAKAPSGRGTIDMPEFIRLYGIDFGSVSRFYELPWSDARLERLERVTHEWHTRLDAIDFDKLDSQGRIDWLLLRNKLTSESARLDLERRRIAEMDELLPSRKIIQELEQARWRMEPLDVQKAAGLISAIPDQVKKVRKRIEKEKKDSTKKEAREKPATDSTGAKDDSPGREDPKPAPEPALKISPSLARRTASAVSDLRGTLKGWAGFYDGFVPEFSWWMKKPDETALTALDDYAKWLREEIAGLKGGDEEPLIGDPIGATALEDDIAAEMLPYSAEQLIAIGEKEFAWCEARMKEAAQEMGLDWKAALAKVKGDYVPPGQQDSVVLEEARKSIQFLKDHELVTIPPLAEEIWRMTMLQPDAQKTMPYAAYSGPNMLVAYAKDEMKHEDKLMSMRGNNRHFMHIVVPHELIPGHHLQGFQAARHRAYRSAFSTPFLVEGWSLYWELMLWELNYSKSPEDRIGMLFWRMHRCARIIVSLKFHLGKMTPAEMVNFIVERVGHEKLGATSEVRRFITGGYSPLYQCGYMIGGLQLRALRRELVEAGKLKDREFNDAILAQGPIPIEFIRAALTQTPLRRDARPQWKFAGD